jgi:hypothetical protein
MRRARLPVGHVVAIQVCGPLIGGDQQIQVAVAVEIAIGQSARHFGRSEATAGCGRDIAEAALPVVVKQMGRLRVAVIAA